MKKYLNHIIIAGLSILIILTFVSRSVYNKNLPQVSAVPIISTFVPLSHEAVGFLHYPNEVEIIAGGNWTIAEVFVAENELVEEGDVLLLFDTRASNIEIKQLELEILHLQNALDALEDWQPQTGVERRSKSRQQSELSASLEIAVELRELKFSQLPPENGLIAPIAGRVSEIILKSGDALLPGDILLSLRPDEKPQLSFELPPIEGEAFSSGSLVNAIIETVTQEDGKDVYARQMVAGRIISGILRENRWFCVANLNDFVGRAVGGQDIPFTVIQQGEIQNNVIPLTSIFERDNNTFVYIIEKRNGLFGEESYLIEISVDVIYDNGFSAAIDGSFMFSNITVAYDPSHPVEHGDVVWVRD